MKRKLLTRFDFIFVILIIILTLFIFIQQNNDDSGDIIAQISVGGNVIQTINLSQPLFSNGWTGNIPELEHVIFHIEDEQIRILQIDCALGVCMRRGFISRPGQINICLPNRLSIRILNRSHPDVDIIAW